jgi:hypothetical protein
MYVCLPGFAKNGKQNTVSHLDSSGGTGRGSSSGSVSPTALRFFSFLWTFFTGAAFFSPSESELC